MQKDLIANENGEAIYDFGYQTAVLVCENQQKTEILDEIKPQKVPQKRSKKWSKKWSKMKVPVFPSKIVEDVFKALKLNPKARYSWLVDNLGVSESTIKRAINDLKELGYINSEHSKVKGVWQLLK